MDSSEGQGWREYQKLVLNELRRLDTNLEKLTDRIDAAVKHERSNRQISETAMQSDIRKISLEVRELKIKAGVWGLLGGLLPVLTALMLKLL